jgi:alpha-1,3-mannosyltransferase
MLSPGKHRALSLTSLVMSRCRVMRDVAGARAIDSHPFLRHEASAERVKKGLPLPVQCCWNGMAAFSALPFKQGIKIRSHLAGECAASECSLLCDDMHRMGYRNVMVDPSVRVAYKADDFNRMHSEPGPLMYTPYKDLAGQLSYKELISTELFKRSDMVECCDLPPDSDQIAWGKPDACRFLNVTATNYTAPYVHGLF